jgi:hypothetical protein
MKLFDAFQYLFKVFIKFPLILLTRFKINLYRTPVARILVRQAHAQTKCVSTPYFVGGDNLAYLVFACLFAKTNVLNYVG